MATSVNSILIGDLLILAQMTTPRDMADAMPITLKTGLPLGRVLIGAGALTAEHLRQALLAQSLIRDSLLSMDLAVQALRIVVRENFSLEQALKIVGWAPESFIQENRLGQLLVSSGIITQHQLEEALRIFFATGLPLARVLVLKGWMTNLVAYAALTSQQLLRDDKLTREQALHAVRSAASSKAVVDSDQINEYLQFVPSTNVRVGELLVAARMVSEEDLVSAVESSLDKGEVLGEVLVHRGLISPDSLERALEAQRLVTKNILEPRKAGDVLRKADYERMSVKTAMERSGPAQLLSEAYHASRSESEPFRFQSEAPSFASEGAESLQHELPEFEPAQYWPRVRTVEEARARQLATRLIAKLEALFVRNNYLCNTIDKDNYDRRILDSSELQQLKIKAETCSDFEECMDLIDALISRIESYAYHNGYLRNRLDVAAHVMQEREERPEPAHHAEMSRPVLVLAQSLLVRSSEDPSASSAADPDDVAAGGKDRSETEDADRSGKRKKRK